MEYKINHSDRTKIQRGTSGRVPQQWCDSLIETEYRSYEVLNAVKERLTPTLGFKKIVLSD